MNFLKTCGAVIAFASVCSLLNACTPSQSETHSSLLEIKGDPRTFIAGTLRDTKSGIPKALLEGTTSEWSLNRVGFVEESRTTTGQSLRQQRPISVQEGQRIIDGIKEPFTLVPHPITPNQYFFETRASLGSPKLLFENKEGKLHLLKTFNERGRINPMEQVEHYSVKNSKEAFSILVSGIARKSRYVYSYTFTKIQDVSILQQTMDAAYTFLYGKGIPMTQKEGTHTKLQICGSQQTTLNSWFQTAIENWTPHLKNRLAVTSEIVEACPPFSDLNTATVSYVDEWIEITGEYGALGMTLTSPDFFKNEILDSDLFFLMDEWEESISAQAKVPHFQMNEKDISNNATEIKEPFLRLATHEIGHYLGLNHVGKSFGNDTISIMSYDLEIKTPQEYDILAVQELYPLKGDLKDGPEAPSEDPIEISWDPANTEDP